MISALSAIDQIFFYILWTLAFIPAALQFNYLTLFFLSRLKKKKKLIDFQQTNFPEVDILIAAYNERDVIGKTLRSVAELKYPKKKLRVIVVDDYSQDGTDEIVEEEFKKMKKAGIRTKLVQNGKGGFKSGALKEGLKYVKGKYIVGLDADTIVPEDFLLKSVPFMVQNPDKKYLNFKIDYYNKDFNIITKAYSFTSFLGDDINKNAMYRLKIPFTYHGGCVILETDFLKRIGGWQPGIIAEDADIAFRAWMHGASGEYVEDLNLYSTEAIPSYKIWKHKNLRVSKGTGQVFAKNIKGILKSKLSFFQKLEFIFVGIQPFFGFFPLMFTFVAFAGMIMSVLSVQQIFTSLSYILLSIFLDLYLVITTLFVMRKRNLPVKDYILPLIVTSVIAAPIAIYNMVGYVEGLLNKNINFLKTPKFGDMKKFKNNFNPTISNKLGLIEIGFVFVSLVFAILSFERQLYYVTAVSSMYLCLSLLAALLI